MKYGSIKSTKTRNDGITAWISEEILLWQFITCQCSLLSYAVINAKVGNFLTEPCCNTTTSCFSTFYRSLLHFEILNFKILVCLVF